MLVRNVADLDIENAMFVIVCQTMSKLEVRTGSPVLHVITQLSSWNACASDRDAALKHLIEKLGKAEAKALNIAIANGRASSKIFLLSPVTT